MMNVSAFNLLLDLVRNSDWMTLMPLSTLAGDLEDLALREVVNSNVIAEYFVVRSAAAKFNEAADSFIAGLMRALDHERGLCRQYIANLLARRSGSAARRVGQACVRTCSSRGRPS